MNHRLPVIGYLLFAFIVAACAAPTVPAGNGGGYEFITPAPTTTPATLGLSNADAQAALRVAEQTATEAARQVVQATEAARATQQAYSFAVTQTADAITLREMQQASEIRMTQAAATATQYQADAENRHTQATIEAEVHATQVAKDGQKRELESSAWFGFRVIGIIALFAFLYLLLEDHFAKRRIERARQQAEVERAKVEAAQNKVKRWGNVFIVLTSDYNWQVLEQFETEPQALIEGDEFMDEQNIVDEIPYRRGGVLVGTLRLQREQPERQRVIRLLRAAIAQSGPGEMVIPSAQVLGWHPQEWQSAVNSLKGVQAVYTKQGRNGGTFLYNWHKDLTDLLNKVLSRELLSPAPLLAEAQKTPKSSE